jgi:hypothetical protein
MIKPGQKITISCPVYHNGKKFNGIITKIIKDKNQVMVLIDKNSKSTKFSIHWIV